LFLNGNKTQASKDDLFASIQFAKVRLFFQSRRIGGKRNPRERPFLFAFKFFFIMGKTNEGGDYIKTLQIKFHCGDTESLISDSKRRI